MSNVKTLVATPDPQDWREVLPIWALDVLDDFMWSPWRKYFQNADFHQDRPVIGDTEIYVFLKGDDPLVDDWGNRFTVIVTKRQADELYARRARKADK